MNPDLLTAPAPTLRTQPCPRDRLLRERLVQQQFWLFGADIRHPEGNLLLELGFRRHRAAHSSPGSSCYVWCREALSIHLWGFGCCLTTSGMDRIYLSRHRAMTYRMSELVVLEALSSVTQLDDHCRGARPAEPRHEAALFRWFADYERQIHARVGQRAREATLERYGSRKLGPSVAIPDMWVALAAKLA